MPEITPATPTDAPEVLELLLACEATERQWADASYRPAKGSRELRLAGMAVQLASGSAVALAAREDDRLVGFACAVPAEQPGRAELTTIAVDPERWGSGHARALLSDLLPGLAGAGYDEVELWTHRDNERARRLYDQGGWRLSGEESTHPHTGVPLVQYVAAPTEVDTGPVD